MDTTTKTGTDAAKTASKREVQKKSGELSGNIIADKIISVSKTKKKKKEDERQEIYIALEKKQHIIDNLRLL